MNKLSINYTPNALTLSSFSGLKIFDNLVQKFEIKNLVGTDLPQKELLQELMPTLGMAMRKSLEPMVHKVILTMDSSDHEQYGVKSKGVDFGYRKFRCLNSQNIFDDSRCKSPEARKVSWF